MAKPKPLTFSPISIEDLVSEIKKSSGDGPDGLVKLLGLKVRFGLDVFENSAKSVGPRNLMGYHTLVNGLTFCGMCAGYKDNVPVFFIVYWDGKKLKGYVPTEGNPWNTENNYSYGMYPASDAANLKERRPDYSEEAASKKNFQWYDSAAIQKDIMANVVSAFPKLGLGALEPPKDAPPPVISDLSNLKPLKKLPIGQLPPAIKKGREQRQISLLEEKPKKKSKQKEPATLQERIEALKFYGEDDAELFTGVCELAHDLYIFGHAGKAEVAVSWAEELAFESRQWAEENRTLKDANATKGVWE